MPLDGSVPDAPAEPDPAEDRAALRLRKLQELSDIGIELARALGRRAAEAAETPDGGDLALAFSRVSRAVRQTVALEERLEQGFQVRKDALSAVRAEAAKRVDLRRMRGNAHKLVAYDAIGEAIEADAKQTGREDADVERLFDDLHERLADKPDIDFADRAIGEIIASICRDLGVTPDWGLWPEEDWEEEAEEAGLLDAPAERPSTEPDEGAPAEPQPQSASP